MKASHIIIVLTAIALALPVEAKQKRSSSRPGQTEWMKGVREYKYDMLIQEVELTKEQQEQFLPLYQKMEDEIMRSNKEVRDLEAKITNSKDEISDLEYGLAAEAMVNASAVAAKIEADYFKQFAQILSKRQLFLLKRAETRFAKSIISTKSARKKQ